jgi:hypothetical protein
MTIKSIICGVLAGLVAGHFIAHDKFWLAVAAVSVVAVASAIFDFWGR